MLNKFYLEFKRAKLWKEKLCTVDNYSFKKRKDNSIMGLKRDHNFNWQMVIMNSNVNTKPSPISNAVPQLYVEFNVIMF